MRWGLTALFTYCFLLFSAPLYAGTVLEFNPEPKGLNARMARLALSDKITPAEEALQRGVPLATARFDLNSDGVPELFVKLLEEKFFCDSTGCDTFVLSIDAQGPKKLVSFRGTDIEIQPNSRGKTHNLAINQAGTKNILTYEWQNNGYILVEDE